MSPNSDALLKKKPNNNNYKINQARLAVACTVKQLAITLCSTCSFEHFMTSFPLLSRVQTTANRAQFVNFLHSISHFVLSFLSEPPSGKFPGFFARLSFYPVTVAIVMCAGVQTARICTRLLVKAGARLSARTTPCGCRRTARKPATRAQVRCRDYKCSNETIRPWIWSVRSVHISNRELVRECERLND